MGTDYTQSTTSILLPKLLMVCLGGWGLASVATLESPDAVKLVQLENVIQLNPIYVTVPTTKIPTKNTITTDE